MALFKFISRLFTRGPAPQLSEAQVIALIDALTYAMLIDRRIASAEQEALHEELSKHPWDGAMPIEHHINEGVRRARGLFESTSDGQPYLKSIAARLGDPGLKKDTFMACVQLAHADEDYAESERELLEAMGRAFELDPGVVARLIEA